MRFWTLSPHTSRLSLETLLSHLCVVWKTPPQTLSPGPLFLLPVSSPVRFWKPCTHSPASIHRDLNLLSTLPPTTVTTTSNIFTFTQFLRSILLPSEKLSPHPRHSHPPQYPPPPRKAPRRAHSIAGSHKMPPEIHRGDPS